MRSRKCSIVYVMVIVLFLATMMVVVVVVVTLEEMIKLLSCRLKQLPSCSTADKYVLVGLCP